MVPMDWSSFSYEKWTREVEADERSSNRRLAPGRGVYP
jgi:hypothetical protein